MAEDTSQVMKLELDFLPVQPWQVSPPVSESCSELSLGPGPLLDHAHPRPPSDTASRPQGASDGRDGQEGFCVRGMGVVGSVLPERGLVVLGS